VTDSLGKKSMSASQWTLCEWTRCSLLRCILRSDVTGQIRSSASWHRGKSWRRLAGAAAGLSGGDMSVAGVVPTDDATRCHASINRDRVPGPGGSTLTDAPVGAVQWLRCAAAAAVPSAEPRGGSSPSRRRRTASSEDRGPRQHHPRGPGAAPEGAAEDTCAYAACSALRLAARSAAFSSSLVRSSTAFFSTRVSSACAAAMLRRMRNRRSRYSAEGRRIRPEGMTPVCGTPRAGPRPNPGVAAAHLARGRAPSWPPSTRHCRPQAPGG
jgi:hypothetical protein